jgi:carbonic anhydrase/acetyltransferase-like protein (isoleucine patch superfamily)
MFMKKELTYHGVKPIIHKESFVARSADVIGRVTIGKDSSIWFQCVLRGDINTIQVGEGTNIQDHTVLHISDQHPVTIGDYVTIGHSAIIHGCEIEDNVLIGMGACILDGAHISKNSIVGARSLVTKGKVFEEGSLIMGSPAKVIRKLTEEEIQSIGRAATKYIGISKDYSEEDV